MREKGWEERGPKSHSKNSDFGTPLILVLFSGLPLLSYLEDRNLLKLRSLDSSCPFFLSDNSIWGQ